MTLRERIPYALVVLRFALGPCFLLGYALGARPWLYVALLWVAIISDILDGTLARRWHTTSSRLRRWDSNADSVCFGLAAVTVVLLHAAYLAPWRWGLAAMFVLILAQNVLNLVRYGRQPAYHMWSGKLWSIVYVVALTGLFSGWPSAWAIDALIALSLYSSVENLIASSVLREPMTDIPTAFHALRIAKQ